MGVKVIAAGEQVELSELASAILGWLLDHDRTLNARDNGTITVSYSITKGTVEVAHLGRDSVKFIASPRR